jgi:hypothetical protein
LTRDGVGPLLIAHKASRASSTAARDPILPAIEAHVFAVARFENTFGAVEGPDDAQAHAVSSDEADAAAWAMLQVEPSSLYGVWVLLTYFANFSENDQQHFPEAEDGEVYFPAALARHAALALSRLMQEGAR